MKTRNLLTGTAVLATACLAPSGASAANLFGVDVSSTQGSINWSSVHGGGASFAFAQAVQGTTYHDPDYTNNMVRGKNAGLQMGPYDLVKPNTDCPGPDATYFWNYAGGEILNDGKTLSPVCYLTETGHSCTTNITEWVNEWAAAVESKTTLTMNPILFCAIGTCCDLIPAGQSGGIELASWVASYNGENLFTGGPWSSDECCNAWSPCGTAWQFWQVTDTGRISGISGNVDFDAFDGSLTTLKELYDVK